MLLKIKNVDIAGRPVSAKSVAIQSFGKAFLLPLDVILGWIFTNDRRQRIFNRASDTLVVKIRKATARPERSTRMTREKIKWREPRGCRSS